MKKKTGFTLAEILVSLGIIGVIAAVTMPTLTANTQNAQIGPKLAKAVATFEQANQTLLHEYNADSLTNTGIIDTGGTQTYGMTKYIETLQDYMKVTGTYSTNNIEPSYPSDGWAEGNFIILKDLMKTLIV